MKLSKSIEVSLRTPGFGVPLSHIEHRLGTDLVRLVVPEGVDDPVIEAFDIYDAGDGDVGGAGMLLSLISAEVMRPEELSEAIAAVSRSGCAAIALKLGDFADERSDNRDREAVAGATAEAILHEIIAAGLAAVVLAPETNWREFDALMTRELGESAQSLTQLPSSGDKLFALANSIARVFGGSTAIEDHRRGILAHSSVPEQVIDDFRTTGILFRRVGDAPVNEERYRRVLAADGIVRFPRYYENLPRAAIAVRAGAIPLGSIWVIDPAGGDHEQTELSAEQQAALREGAIAAADAILEMRQTGRSTGPRREAAFARTILGSAQAGDREILDPSGGSLGVVLVGSVPKRGGATVQVAELRSALTRHLSIYIPDVVVISEGNEVYALCPTGDVDVVRGWALDALSEVSSETVSDVHLGLSDPHPTGTHLSYGIREAREIAECAAEEGVRAGTLAALRPQLFLAECRARLEIDDRYVLPELRELMDAGRNGRQLLRTLEYWLQESGSVARTAARLQVHEQSVRYRLRRLRAQLSLDTAGADYLLAVWMQLRTLRMGRSETRDANSQTPRT